MIKKNCLQFPFECMLTWCLASSISMALGSELTGLWVSRVACVWLSQACSSERACWNWPKARRAPSSLCWESKREKAWRKNAISNHEYPLWYTNKTAGWGMLTCLRVIFSPRLSHRCLSSVRGSWIMSLSAWSETFLSSSSPWWHSFSMSICCWYTSTLNCCRKRKSSALVESAD